jgi:hypothetical protein
LQPLQNVIVQVGSSNSEPKIHIPPSPLEYTPTVTISPESLVTSYFTAQKLAKDQLRSSAGMCCSRCSDSWRNICSHHASMYDADKYIANLYLIIIFSYAIYCTTWIRHSNSSPLGPRTRAIICRSPQAPLSMTCSCGRNTAIASNRLYAAAERCRHGNEDSTLAPCGGEHTRAQARGNPQRWPITSADSRASRTCCSVPADASG